MSVTNRSGRRTCRRTALTAVVVAALAAAALVASAGSSRASADALGQPPPEWAENLDAWPAHNYDLSNTRATTETSINSQTVPTLKVKWRFRLKGTSAFGAFASSPIVLNDTVYLQDLNSNVYALDRESGKVRWAHRFNSPSEGPNGIALGYGRIYGATATSAFALDPSNGAVIWSRKLVRNKNEGIDMAPQLFDNTVLVSTVPGNVNSFYAGHGDGIVWALQSASGKPKWTFNTLAMGAKLWGHPDVNSGGGLWYPPSVDSKGRVFISVANPGPLYGTPKCPAGTGRPGPHPDTGSIAASDGPPGKLLWYQQVFPHDLRDYDVMIPAIVTNAMIGGTETEIVLGASKGGNAFALRAENGKRLWML